MQKNFQSKDWKSFLPIPICSEYPEWQELYDKAWDLAWAHIRSIKGMLQDPYMDEAFCDTQIWIWDTCFMSQFCKYAREVFPGIESFKNFYEVLYDGKSLPKIVAGEKEPTWTKATPGEWSDIYIHIADNPPLFAWGEYENALFSADKAHLFELLYQKQYLQKHYEWIEGLKERGTPRGVLLPTYLIAEELGYRWEGGRSGMDNTPRGREKIRDGRERPKNKNMLWLDAICQQAFSAKIIAEIYRLFDDEANAAIWQERYEAKKKIVNDYYWDDADRFYYDIDVNTHAFYKVPTVASFWPLIAGIASKEQAAALAKHLSDPETFGGEVPLVSLARNDGDYCPKGGYWRGGLWLPTAYMAIKGLSVYGYHKEAHEAATKILRHMLATYKEFDPHTIWECYSPERHAPGTVADDLELARPDFCGWSALGPISLYIEYVLGFCRVDAFEKTVEWRKPKELLGKIGIKNLRFGDLVTDIVANGNDCEVLSNGAYTLIINDRPFAIKEGRNLFQIALS